MGILLKNEIGWSPKQSISNAFFEDAIAIIGEKKEYKLLVNDIKENLLSYSFTLDYRNKSEEEVMRFLEVVVILLYQFDELYSNRTEEEAIIIYKKSLIELKDKLLDYFLEKH